MGISVPGWSTFSQTHMRSTHPCINIVEEMSPYRKTPPPPPPPPTHTHSLENTEKERPAETSA